MSHSIYYMGVKIDSDLIKVGDMVCDSPYSYAPVRFCLVVGRDVVGRRFIVMNNDGKIYGIRDDMVWTAY